MYFNFVIAHLLLVVAWAYLWVGGYRPLGVVLGFHLGTALFVLSYWHYHCVCAVPEVGLKELRGEDLREELKVVFAACWLLAVLFSSFP
jgi:hypothetical protein